jgi:hypothetical protein
VPGIVNRRAAAVIVVGLILFASSFAVGRAGEPEAEPVAPVAAKPPAVRGLAATRALPALRPARKHKRKHKHVRPIPAPVAEPAQQPAPEPEPAVVAPQPVPAPRAAPAPTPTPAPTPAPGGGGFDDSG